MKNWKQKFDNKFHADLTKENGLCSCEEIKSFIETVEKEAREEENTRFSTDLQQIIGTTSCNIPGNASWVQKNDAGVRLGLQHEQRERAKALGYPFTDSPEKGKE